MWVYTTYGEHVASLHGTTRKAGEPATFNGKPLSEKKAKAWSDRGYIYWKETEHGTEGRKPADGHDGRG